MNFLFCAFGGFFVSEALKTVSPFHHDPWQKLFFALIGSTLIAAFIYHAHVYDLAVYGLSGAGFAALIHKTYRTISATGDRQITTIMSNRSRRP